MYKTTVILKKGEGRTLKAGGLWVFDNEIAKIETAILWLFWILTFILWCMAL